MQPDSGIKTWQWVVTAIVIIILIVIGIMIFGNKGAQAPATSDTSMDNSTSTSASAVNRIVMADQYPGNVVYLSSVQMDKPGWVVIKNDKNGQPGDVIGSAIAPAGINPVKITLTSPTVDGATYYAILYSSDGGATFNAATDQPIKDANGNIIMKVFHASASVGASLKG